MVRRAENVETVVHQRGLFTGRGWLTLTIGKQVIRVANIYANQFSAISQEQERVPVSLAGAIGRTQLLVVQVPRLL